jgi:hypothetical protein
MKVTDKRYVPGTGAFYVFHHDHKRAKDRCVMKFATPEEARRVSSQLNGYLAKSDPQELPCKFSFYYVHAIRNSGTLPWIKRVVDLAEMREVKLDGENPPRVRNRVFGKVRRMKIKKGSEYGH